MTDILRSAGAAAGIKNLPKEFNAPIKMAEMEMSRRYGNRYLVNVDVSSKVAGSVANPGAIIRTICAE